MIELLLRAISILDFLDKQSNAHGATQRHVCVCVFDTHVDVNSVIKSNETRQLRYNNAYTMDNIIVWVYRQLNVEPKKRRLWREWYTFVFPAQINARQNEFTRNRNPYNIPFNITLEVAILYVFAKANIHASIYHNTVYIL